MALDGSGEVPARDVSGGGDEESRHHDRISDLPDSLLLQILMLLPLVEAVRTCVLSRRWRVAWTRLPRLAFDDDAAPRVSRFGNLVDGVLRGYADDVDMPDVLISVRRLSSAGDAVRLATSAARLAAGRVTARFYLYLSYAAVNLYNDVEDENAAATTLQLPCFPRATEFALTFMGVDLRMPNAGTFAKLTKMFIRGVRFTDDGEGISTAVSRRCPCLEVLLLHRVRGVKVLALLAQSLLFLRVSLVMQLQRLQVVAGSLREMQVHRCFSRTTAPTSMLLNVPVLEELHWEDYPYPHDDAGNNISLCGLPSCLQKLVIVDLSRFTKILQHFHRADTLRLEIPIALADHAELKVELPYHSELELVVYTNQHKIGPTIVNFLKKSSCVRKLTLQIYHGEIDYTPCMSDCNCRRPSNWRRQNISLVSLKWVVINGFGGTRDEESLLCSIMKNAKGLSKVSIASSVYGCQSI
ncbi:hypothetical protein GQ55_7G146700 [Panicum hallii var. hallii]|uniref:F-box domain-containing protein n=1 Tax=Panicum hallii var. hallii TaxID=1504633 RepID=A0A2T7CV52_9POAL|nr:hypothetical protein GQ55_7G146700 [Panicum hallii var. hallii]